MHRRGFVQNAAALAVGGAIWLRGGRLEMKTGQRYLPTEGVGPVALAV